MRRHLLLPSLILPALLILPDPARGAGMRTVELGVFGGAFFADSSVGVEDDLVYGLRAGYSFTPVHEVELVTDRVDTSFASPSFGDLDEKFTSYATHWLFNFPIESGPFVPYFLVGLGRVDDEVDLGGGATSKDDDFFFPVGGGFRAFTGDNFAVRVELRGKYFKTFDVSQDHWELTLGLSWALGRRR